MSRKTELLRVRSTGAVQITEDIGSGEWYVTSRYLLNEAIAREAVAMCMAAQLELKDYRATWRVVDHMRADRIDDNTIVLGGVSHFGPINTTFTGS